MKRAVFVVLALLVATAGCVPGGGFTITLPTEQLVVTSFDAEPLSVSPGGSSTLSWTVIGATTVRIDPGVGTVALKGSRAVSPTATTIYTLTATNAAGKSVAVTVQVVVSGLPSSGAPVVSSFAASPSSISGGDSSTLSWTVSGATSVTIDQGIGSVASSGTRTVSPSATTEYTLTATNSAGDTLALAVVTVSGTPSDSLPDIEHFAASPSSISDGDSSTLSWDVSGATSVTIDHGIGSVASSGTRTVSPSATTAYKLTATNSEGSVQKTATIAVDEEPEEPDLVVTAIGKVAGSGGYRIGYTIKNQGDGPSPATTSKLYVGGVYKASDSVPVLAAGASVSRQFSSWTYNPNTTAIKIVADANDVVDEEDEDNNEKSVSVAAEVLVNFVNSANLAEWKSGSPETDLTFGGSTGDSNGFACYRTSAKLEDGDTYAKVLETHPKWVASGWIDGFYPELTVPAGAWFVADVGFMNGATGTDGVTFRVWFWQDGSDIPNVLDDVDAEYDGDLDRLDINLASIAGRTGRIGLQVLAGSSSGQDWAVWATAKMIR